MSYYTHISRKKATNIARWRKKNNVSRETLFYIEMGWSIVEMNSREIGRYDSVRIMWPQEGFFISRENIAHILDEILI